MNQKANEARELPKTTVECSVLTEHNGEFAASIEVEGEVTARAVISGMVELAKRRTAFVNFTFEGVSQQAAWTSNLETLLALHGRSKYREMPELRENGTISAADAAAYLELKAGSQREIVSTMVGGERNVWALVCGIDGEAGTLAKPFFELRNAAAGTLDVQDVLPVSELGGVAHLQTVFATTAKPKETRGGRFVIGQRVFVTDAAPFVDGWYVLHRAETVSGQIETPDTIVTLCPPDNAPGDYIRVMASQLRESGAVIVAGKLPPNHQESPESVAARLGNAVGIDGNETVFRGDLIGYAAQAAARELVKSWSDAVRDGNTANLLADVDKVIATLAAFKEQAKRILPSMDGVDYAAKQTGPDYSVSVDVEVTAESPAEAARSALDDLRDETLEVWAMDVRCIQSGVVTKVSVPGCGRDVVDHVDDGASRPSFGM
jgi:hypothetical protein